MGGFLVRVSLSFTLLFKLRIEGSNTAAATAASTLRVAFTYAIGAMRFLLTFTPFPMTSSLSGCHRDPDQSLDPKFVTLYRLAGLAYHT